jgi:hypothetical protein
MAVLPRFLHDMPQAVQLLAGGRADKPLTASHGSDGSIEPPAEAACSLLRDPRRTREDSAGG